MKIGRYFFKARILRLLGAYEILNLFCWDKGIVIKLKECAYESEGP